MNPKLKAKLVNEVLKSDLFAGSCEFFSLEGSDGIKRFQAETVSKADDQIAAIFTIPTTTHNVYATVTDGDRKLVRRILATIEDTERESAVNPGGVLLFDDPELKARDIVGVIFLPVSASNVLDYLPDKVLVDGAEYRFLLVVFLRGDEHETWKKYGHDSLMDLFEQEDKDLISFG
jgi:hypothetical protein